MRRCCKAWLLCAATLLGSVAAQAGPLSTGPADLKFREFFELPIGPRGLAPSARLLSLDGQPVRITGYLAHQETSSAAPGIALLAPLPVSLGDEDESFADDLPASTLYLHLAGPLAAQSIPYRPGLVSLSGTLQVGAQREADGRSSFVRLVLDTESASVLLESPK
jgi:hypothetical protein